MKEEDIQNKKLYELIEVCVSDAGKEDELLVESLYKHINNTYAKIKRPYDANLVDILIKRWESVEKIIIDFVIKNRISGANKEAALATAYASDRDATMAEVNAVLSYMRKKKIIYTVKDSAGMLIDYRSN